MKYTTELKYGEWKNGDVICFTTNSCENKPPLDLVCEVKNDKIYKLPTNDEIIPNENWKCFRIDYKFISDGTWYIEGTEAYPTYEIDSESYYCFIFVGWTNETYIEYTGKLPRWDSELCSLDEFKIEKR